MHPGLNLRDSDPRVGALAFDMLHNTPSDSDAWVYPGHGCAPRAWHGGLEHQGA